MRERKQFLIKKFYHYMAMVEEMNKQLMEMGENVKSISWVPEQDVSG